MGLNVGIRVDGLDENIRAMRRAGVNMDDLKDGWKIVGDEVTQRAKAISPDDTGKLKNSVKPSRRRDGVIISVGGRVPYARYVYFGTKYKPARPFVKVAIGMMGSRLEAAVEAAVNRALQKAGL